MGNFVSMVARNMDAPRPAPPTSLPIPAVMPLGGSKWARFFAGPKQVDVAGAGITMAADMVVYPDGTTGPAASALDGSAATVFPIAAGPAVTLGQFLAGPLGVYVATPTAAALCGGVLSAGQTDVLARLDVLRGYVTLTTPQRFHVVALPDRAGPTMVPGPHITILADRLRAVPAAASTRLAILPPRAREKFCLSNRASLTAWLRAKKVTVIEPETLTLDDLAKTLAGAALLVLADPEQAGLLTLCAPGAKILEIAPEGWLGGVGRQLCGLFGLVWMPFLANPPAYPLRSPLPFGSLVPLSYEIPIRGLAKVFAGLE